VHSALWGVVFCLDFGPFFFSSLVPLPGVFPSFIYFMYMSCKEGVMGVCLGMTIDVTPLKRKRGDKNEY